MYVHTNQRLRAVLDSVDDAILMVDKDFKVVMCNKRFQNYFGVAPSLIIEQDKREVITKEIKWRVSDPEGFQKKLFWLYDNPEVVSNDEVEVVIPRQRVLKRFSGPVYDDDGYLLGRVEVYSDITHQRNLQKELESKNTQLYLLNAAATAISQSLNLETLGQTVLRRLTQTCGAKAGILYIKTKENTFKLASSIGDIKNSQAIPGSIDKALTSETLWGHLKNDPPAAFLTEAFGSGFFIAFPGLNSEGDVNSFCIFIWDNMNEKWLDKQLFANIGVQLSIGIRNALNYKEAQRSAILQERDRLAMEMHDGLAQTLGYLGLGLDSLKKRLKDNNIDDSYELVSQLRKVVDSSYADVREAIIGLRVNTLKDLGLIKAFEEYIQEFYRLTNIKTSLEIKGDPFEPIFESQLHIIRIVQEALTNIRRHSQATEAKVTVSFTGRQVKIAIEDNGRGFDQDEQHMFKSIHQGIRIMHARAAMLGGSLQILSGKKKGTRVILTFPGKNEGESRWE